MVRLLTDEEWSERQTSHAKLQKRSTAYQWAVALGLILITGTLILGAVFAIWIIMVALVETVAAMLAGMLVGLFLRLLRDRWDVRPSVARLPVSQLSRWTAFLVPRKTYERVFETVVNDIQTEYIDALAESPRQARWVWIRGYFVFWQSVVAWALSTTVGRVLRGLFGASWS